MESYKSLRKMDNPIKDWAEEHFIKQELRVVTKRVFKSPINTFDFIS
jgi:hypothetical protein